ncbi:MAG: hypothetical protein Q9227_004698 [Pyrenula ochraceoflavens]
MLGWGRGHGEILDSSYRIVHSIEAGGPQAASDMHEFNLLPDGNSVVMTLYREHQWDLFDYGVLDGMGWIQEGRFQELDVKTGEVLFEWRSLDHIDPEETYVLPATTEISGHGIEPQFPWDYFHINSIDKNEAGDYLISARHVSCIYKINGRTGEIMWRLHGAKPSFKMLNGFSFSAQHDARFIVDNEEETILSFFDNGSNGFNHTKETSAGMIARIDHRAKTAELLAEYFPPDNRLCFSQGNMQLLNPDTGKDDKFPGNVVLGWGNQAWFSEAMAETGEIVFDANFAMEGLMNYRTYKANWTGHPLTRPALWTYSKTGRPGEWIKGEEEQEGGTSWFMSWNGATEVADWKLYGSTESLEGPWKEVAKIPKRGFETIYREPSLSSYTYVEAYDKDGKLLSKSESAKTFIPGEKLRELGNCDDLGCGQATDAGLDEVKKKKEEAAQREDERRKAEEVARHKKLTSIFGTIGGVCGILLLYLAVKFRLHRIVIGAGLGIWDLLLGTVRRRGAGEKGRYSALPNGQQQDGLLGGLETPVRHHKSSMDGRPMSAPRSPQVW